MSSTTLKLLLLFFFYCFVAAQTNTTAEREANRFQKEIKCYGLPYGTTGFISHLLTYYTAIMLTCNKKPLLPWLRLESGSQNNYLGIANLVLTTVSSIASIARCVHTWEFAALAAMKLSLSLAAGILSIYQNEWILLLYLPGAIAGLVGAFSIAASAMSDSSMKLVTGLFWGLAAMTSVTVVIACFHWKKGKFAVAGVLGCVMAYGALYSDWVLVIAAKTGLSGFPHQSPTWVKVVWVFYFIGKRLSLFVT